MASAPLASSPHETVESRASVAPSASASAAVASSPVPSTPPKPSFPAGEMRVLELSGLAPAVVAYPRVTDLVGVPLVVALHGNFDRPEWQCETWAAVSEWRAIVLCPRGDARADTPSTDKRYTYDSYARMKKEIFDGIAALREQLDLAVDHPLMLIGFSLGANLGAQLLLDRDAPTFFSTVMIEGGGAQWSWHRVRAFRERGGRHVLFACGQVGCAHKAEQLRRRFEKSGLSYGVVKTSIGHTYDGEIAAGVGEHWTRITATGPTRPRGGE